MIPLFHVRKVWLWELISWLITIPLSGIRSFVLYSFQLKRGCKNQLPIMSTSTEKYKNELVDQVPSMNCKLILSTGNIDSRLKSSAQPDEFVYEDKFRVGNVRESKSTQQQNGVLMKDETARNRIAPAKDTNTQLHLIQPVSTDGISKRNKKKRRKNKNPGLLKSKSERIDNPKIVDGETEKESEFKKIAGNVMEFLGEADSYRKMRLNLQHDAHRIEETISENKSALVENGKFVKGNILLSQTKMSCKQVARKEINCLNRANKLMEKILPSTTISAAETQIDTIRKFVIVDQTTESLLDEDCPCYRRFKLLIQRGVGEAGKLRDKLKTTQLYYEMNPNDPSTRVPMAQIMITSELALFMEYSKIPESSSSLLSDIHSWSVGQPASWRRQLHEDFLCDPNTEIDGNSSRQQRSAITSLERLRNVDPSYSISETLFSHIYHELATNMFRKLTSYKKGEKLKCPDLSSISSTPYIWTMFLLLHISCFEEKEDMSSSKLDMKRRTESADTSSSSLAPTPTKAEMNIKELTEKDLQRDETGDAYTLDTDEISTSLIHSSGDPPGTLCSKERQRMYPPLEQQCKHHPLVTGMRRIDHLEFMTSFIIRLMKRRVHNFTKIVETDSSPCIVCGLSLSTPNSGPSVYCIVCQAKIHLDCNVYLFDFCAPVPQLTSEQLKRNRFVLDDYVNPEFKPRIPALIVHITFLIMFGGYKARDLYRNPETDVKFEAFKKLVQKGWSPNLLTLEPLLLGELLKYFLDSLKPRLISESLFKKMKSIRSGVKGTLKTVQKDLDLCRNTFAESPAATRETLIFLFIHLQEVSAMKEVKMTISDLTRAFTPVLIDGFKREQSFSYYPVIERALRLPREIWMSLFSEYVEALGE